jgi:S-DNA-T family DNA segregation ATPase FtsK/SpoIIIE
MARRRATTRGGRRPSAARRKQEEALAAAVVGLALWLPTWTLRQLGHLWEELSDDQQRELKGLGLLALGVVAFVAALLPTFPGHGLLLGAVGGGWPLVVGLQLIGGGILLHPPKRPVQRLQIAAALVVAWAILGFLDLIAAPAGGWLGSPAPAVARAIGPWWTGVILAVLVGVAVWLASRVHLSNAIPRILRRPVAEKSAPAVGDRRLPTPPPGAARVGGAVASAAVVPGGEAESETEPEAELDHPAAAPAAINDGVWKLPRIELLAQPVARTRVQEAETKRQVSAIETKLAEQKIKANVIAVNDGPSITQYVVELGSGVLVKQVEALQKDLSLVLAASPLRIQAPIPGMAAIGIEVPKRSRRVVRLRELLEADEAARFDRAGLMVGLGANVAGTAVFGDLAKAPHLLVAGATGQGKSVFENALVMSLVVQHTPRTLRLVMIDPKRVELAGYNGLPHLAFPVVVEPDEATAALAGAVAEMEARYKILAREGVRNIAAYNVRRAARGESPMPFIVVLIDELADLMMVSRAKAQIERRSGSEVEDLIVRLGQLARAVGIHLVVATQRPSVDVITGLIKANIPSRVAFTVSSGADSRTILSSVGAEKLTGKGDLLYEPVDGEQVRLQSPLVEDGEVEAVVAHWSRQRRPEPLVLGRALGVEG